MNKIQYDLKRSFKYSHKGSSNNEAKSVVMFEPDYSNPDYFMDMQDIVSTSQMKLMSLLKDIIPEKKEDETPSGDALEKIHRKDLKAGLEAIEAEISSSIKGAGRSSDLINAFRKMIKHSNKAIVMIDDIEKMESFSLNKVWPIDLFNMAVRWVSFFVIAPDEQESQSSGTQSDSVGQVTEV